MRNYRIVLVSVLLLSIFSNTVNAQTLVQDSMVFSILKNAQLRLANKSSYKYGIVYRYSNESTPSITLDSLSGYIASDKGRYHLKLGTTEMISNAKVSLSLFNDDRVIYLTKALADSVIEPSMQFSKLVKAFPKVEGSVVITKKDSILKVSFPGNDLYKSITFYIDRRDHFLSKVIYIAKTEALFKSGMISAEDKSAYDEYARIEALFTNFQENINAENEFNESDYLKKENDVYAGVGNYSNYKIIVGSPGL